MPDGMTDLVDRLRKLRALRISPVRLASRKVIIEKVGNYMPGNSGPSAAKFARHCGHIECACYCLGFSTEQVAPQKWMKALGTMPKDKAQRKRHIKELMARKHPHLIVTLVNADALGIMEWGEHHA